MKIRKNVFSNFRADENSVDTSASASANVDKIDKIDKIDVSGADEEELIDRIVEKLLPEIRKAIRNEKAGTEKETETGIMTPSR